MAVIENFDELSVEEQLKFAEALVKTLNSERTFTTETDLKVVEVDAQGYSGDLVIVVETVDTIEVSQGAHWQAADEDDARSSAREDSDLVDYDSEIYDEVKKALKTTEAEIEGYRVSIEVEDVDAEVEEVDVDHIEYEDSGIGSYEFWGDVGYDSHPYVEVDGTIISSCSCVFSLYVEPTGSIPEVTTDEEEI